jgi:cold shock CspA family protein
MVRLRIHHPEDGTADVFAHFSAIAGEGYKNLDENMKVEYDVTQSPNGPAGGECTRDHLIVADERCKDR